MKVLISLQALASN